MDETNEVRKEIAYRRWQLTGCNDMDLNWKEAGKIIMHFLDRRPEQSWWRQDEEDYSVYRDIIYPE